MTASEKRERGRIIALIIPYLIAFGTVAGIAARDDVWVFFMYLVLLLPVAGLWGHAIHDVTSRTLEDRYSNEIETLRSVIWDLQEENEALRSRLESDTPKPE